MTQHLADQPARTANGRYQRLIDADAVESFYCSLDAKSRRHRFGAGVSDQAIKTYCRSINWRSIVAIGLERGAGLEAVLEIHPCSATGATAELAVASRAAALNPQTLSTLLRLSSLVAAAAGVHTLVFVLEPGCSVLSCLHQIGKVTLQDDQAYVDLHLHGGPRR